MKNVPTQKSNVKVYQWVMQVLLPGPLASLSISRPRRNMTALSYSGTTWKRRFYHLVHASFVPSLRSPPLSPPSHKVLASHLTSPSLRKVLSLFFRNVLTFISMMSEKGKNIKTSMTEMMTSTTVHRDEPQPVASSWSSSPWIGWVVLGFSALQKKD